MDEKATAISEPTNGAEPLIEFSMPYYAAVTIEGTADLLFHAWDCAAVEEKAKARKNSKAKKTDNIESYVYRDSEGYLSLPSEYLRMSIINAAKFKQDPRSPRKSAMDLFKAGIVSLEPLCRIINCEQVPAKTWDFIHQCRVTINRQGITRCRPALRSGWRCKVPFLVNLPEYIDPQMLNDTIQSAGRLIGVGDFRPTYGRFQVINFQSQGYPLP